ncbi:MAG: ergothioneine biosynthesis protein EgtC [Oscillatoriales cyanobacterium SM2_2_1]|nr:ergothioneine biosynthesis protein EgtC [Oscillatoriales cyanobacterium SM2_2_1]
MCRLLAYLGNVETLETLLILPEHSLVVQGYQPMEMTAGLLNADGFGIGWYQHSHEQAHPYLYRNTLPIWNDVNLPHLARYIQASCFLANVRSATPGLAVDLSNCQPYAYERFLFVHNGFIERFRHTLYRPLRAILEDEYYQFIQGMTDSEHLFALVLHNLALMAVPCVMKSLVATLRQVLDLAKSYGVSVSLNVIISDGDRLIASRCASLSPAPSLYWLWDESRQGVIVASERIFTDWRWNSFTEGSVVEFARSHPPEVYVL